MKHICHGGAVMRKISRLTAMLRWFDWVCDKGYFFCADIMRIWTNIRKSRGKEVD